MKNKKIGCLIFSAIISMSLVFTGCSNNDKTGKLTSEPKVKEKIVYALNTAPTGVFNPLIANTTYDDAVNDLVYSSFLAYDKDYNLKDDMAESHEISSDNLVYKFKLKKDIKWHDGKDLTMDDIEFTFKTLANKNYEGSSKDVVEKVKGVKEYSEGKADSIEGIKVNGDTIEFHFEKPYSVALGKIGTTPIIPKHIWAEVPVEKWTESSDILGSPVGSGPYKFIKFEKGQSVEFERNDEFYGDKAKTKKFVFKVTNPETVQGELQNGTIDVADVSTLKKKDREDLSQKKFELVNYPKNAILYMGINLRQDRFQDVKVRQALMHGINRKDDLEKRSEGNGILVNVPMLPSSWAYPKDAGLNEYNYDVEKSKTLLKEAGWEDKDKDGILENSKDEKFKVKLHCPSGNKDQEQRALLIQSNLKDVGIDVEILTMEFSTLMQQVVGDHEFDLYLMANMLPIDPDAKPYWHSTAASDKKNTFGWNISSYKNPEADKLMEQGIEVSDMNKRKEIYKDYAKIMNNDVPWVYFFSPNIVKATNPKLKNFTPNTNLDFIDVENWYIEE
ncbi:ABC transporter substrate-binding protein [Clostridium algidicarnis]|uniref:ABC transporter substrate-binding protein n=1 Tax=Clostridium algidicarnis TaxID=37659 RepID=UPI001C0C9189|nr:ABC transporter substrate-binding protein [Clostridium algidicarnis]MBU3207286.1 ABC transporter substrate-binding protein [Clostridium algidicarnis]